MENASFLMAFVSGILAFFSPCMLPLIPAYISYLTGISFHEITGELSNEKKARIKLMTVLHSLGFIMGFTVVFVILGAGATFLGKLLVRYQFILMRIGGLVVIFFALVIADVIKAPFLEREMKVSYRKNGVSILGSILVGATFAAAWTPCVGLILGSILIYASSTASMRMGVSLLIVFSCGLGLPFLLSALIMNSFLAYVKKIERHMRWVRIISGIILMIFGILLLIGRMFL
ncbi:MAG: hypothetical protein A2Z72_06085 [Omnitrophica bacterium RBG_13_46_9]|nr:MAG: hypothetical protein A2Z72_06085 [Omnitrophica bacterium RBG_13_46_9]